MALMVVYKNNGNRSCVSDSMSLYAGRVIFDCCLVFFFFFFFFGVIILVTVLKQMFCFLLVALCFSNKPVYLKDGSVQTIECAATLR